MTMVLPPRDEIYDYLNRFRYFDQAGHTELDREYIGLHSNRFIRTLQMIPPLPPRARILEIGAGPYFLTLLLQKYLDCELDLSNCYSDYGQPAQGELWETVSDVHDGQKHAFRAQQFNAERDPFPYPDGRFDLVLCCEVLEHLILDPSHMLREIHRVLKPGAYLLLTTPNQLQIDHVVSLLRGRNIAHRYSGYGVYGRHNREYTPSEVDRLLRLHNLVPHWVHVENVYRGHTFLHRCLTRWGPLRRRGDTIFALAQAVDQAVQRYPDWLYAEQWSRRRVTRGTIVIGDGDVFQLGTGWHEFDHGPPGNRWTQREAVAFLKAQGQECVVGFQAHAGPPGAQGEVLVQGQLAGSFVLEPGAAEAVVLPLPPDVQAGIASGVLREVEVCIRMAAVFIPAQVVPGSPDTRELGIAVSRLWLG